MTPVSITPIVHVRGQSDVVKNVEYVMSVQTLFI